MPPFDDRDVIAGQGTIGLELAEDVDEIDRVLVPISGGGLISGIAVAIKALSPRTQVIGVEPALAGDAAESFRRGERVAWTSEATDHTIADGLRTPEVGELPWAHIRELVDDVVTVEEDEIRRRDQGACARVAAGRRAQRGGSGRRVPVGSAPGRCVGRSPW